MCGIAGIWTPNLDAQRVRRALDLAVTRLRHRGPDDSGTWLNDAGVGLAHTRLSILDLSRLGHQPMISEDGRHVLVFNGEIYNFAAIRADLLSLGHTFRSNSDTEVVLRAFREWGSDAVTRFIGMFAFAIWDEEEQCLELVRDRVGVKPLYYGWHGGTLCFGSELKALRAFGHWAPEISRESLGEFLQYGYIAADRSIYQGVHKLLPGHRLKLRRGQDPVIERYWSVLDYAGRPLAGDDRSIEADLEELLVSAFRYRMVADVPVGVFLSGGVDSSLLTALLARHHDQVLHTFTIGFEEDDHDESRWARRVAEHCGTAHTEYILGMQEALKIARDWGSLFDEPFGDSSGIPTLLVSRIARQDVKVVLSADGGDELFSGYGLYDTALRGLGAVARLPTPLAGAASSILARLGRGRVSSRPRRSRPPTSVQRVVFRRACRLSTMLTARTPARMMDACSTHWYPEEVARLIGGYRSPRNDIGDYPGTAAVGVSLWDFHHYLPDDILTKVDRTTMAVGLEGRDPLLDHRLAEFAFRLPDHLRRGTLGPKHILKSILYRHVPRALVDRPKQGFGIPLAEWLRQDLRELVHDYLGESRIRSKGIMDHRMIGNLVHDFEAGNDTLTYPLWFVLAFEMWRDRWDTAEASAGIEP